MKIIGHRGAAGLALENTLAGVSAAVRAGVDAVEFDVRLTKDGQFILCHDTSTERISDTVVKIAEKNLKQLMEIRLKNGEKIASLDQALKVAGTTPVLIEAKGSGWAEALAGYVQHKKQNLSVISFNHPELAHFHKLAPGVPSYALERTNAIEVLQLAKHKDFAGIDLNYHILNPFVYWLAKRRKKQIIVYTVNRVAFARFLKFFFPDIWITTNYPDRLAVLR